MSEGGEARNHEAAKLVEALAEIDRRADEPGFSAYGARNIAREALDAVRCAQGELLDGETK